MERVQTTLILVEHVVDWNNVIERELFVSWLLDKLIVGQESDKGDSLTSNGRGENTLLLEGLQVR
jgi:hypothetical protein